MYGLLFNGNSYFEWSNGRLFVKNINLKKLKGQYTLVSLKMTRKSLKDDIVLN